MSLATHCFVLGAALCAGPVLAVANATPVAGGIVLVISPPWIKSEDVIASSDGRALGPVSGRLSMLAVSQNPSFFSNLKSNGAWFVVDASRIAQLCGALE